VLAGGFLLWGIWWSLGGWLVGLELTVNFLEGELFCFADEAEDHAPGDEVQTGVEADF
jgi:hypothetical protein